MGKRRLLVYGSVLLGCLLLGGCGFTVYLFSLPGQYSGGIPCFLHRFSTKALDFEGPFLELDHFEYVGPGPSVRYRAFYRLKQSGAAFVDQIQKDYPNEEWDSFGVSGPTKGGGFRMNMENASNTIGITLSYGSLFAKIPEFVVVEDELLPPPSTH